MTRACREQAVQPSSPTWAVSPRVPSCGCCCPSGSWSLGVHGCVARGLGASVAMALAVTASLHRACWGPGQLSLVPRACLSLPRAGRSPTGLHVGRWETAQVARFPPSRVWAAADRGNKCLCFCPRGCQADPASWAHGWAPSGRAAAQEMPPLTRPQWLRPVGPLGTCPWPLLLSLHPRLHRFLALLQTVLWFPHLQIFVWVVPTPGTPAFHGPAGGIAAEALPTAVL